MYVTILAREGVVYLHRRMCIVLFMILVFVLSSSSISLAGLEDILPVVIKTSNIESAQDVYLGAGEVNQPNPTGISKKVVAYFLCYKYPVFKVLYFNFGSPAKRFR